MSQFGFFYFLANIAEKSLTFALIPIHTYYLAPDEYGILGMLLIAVTWSHKFVAAPVGNGILREYHTLPKKEQSQALFSGYLFVIAQLVVISIMLFCFAEEISYALFSSSKHSGLVKAFILLVITQPLYELMASLLKVQGKAQSFLFIGVLSSVLGFLTQVIIFQYTDLRIASVAVGLGTGSGICSLIMAKQGLSGFRFALSKSLLKRILHFGYPLLISALAAATLVLIERSLIQSIKGAEQLGVYLLAFKLATIVNIAIANPLKQSFVPIVYSLEKNPNNQRSFVSKTCHLFMAASLIFWIVIALFSEELVTLISSNTDYNYAATVLPILALGNCIFAVMSFFSLGMNMARKSFLVSMTSLVRLVVASGLLILLLPFFGLVGAAVASTISMFVLMAIRSFYSAKLYDLYFDWRKLTSLFIGSISLYSLQSVSEGYYDLLYVKIIAKVLCIFALVYFIWKIVFDYEDRLTCLRVRNHFLEKGTKLKHHYFGAR